MNGDDLSAADQEDRSFNRLRRDAGEKAEYSDDLGRDGGPENPFSPDYFNSTWEGR